MNKVVIKNFFFAFGAQVVSLSASLLITFFAPALIEREEFAYWQLFLTYVTYVNITRLGISDGLYLRLGGKRYEELDFELLNICLLSGDYSTHFCRIDLLLIYFT